MNPRSFLVLSLLALLTVGVAILALRSNEESVRAVGAKEKLYPELLPRINDVATIEIVGKEGASTLQRVGEAWGLAEKNGFPVSMQAVRKLAHGIAELTLVEEKTDDPTRYERLGVQDPGTQTAEGTASSLVTLKDPAGKELAKLIVGKVHDTKGALMSNQQYVRKAGEARSWLVAGKVEVQPRAVDWLDKNVVDVPRERVRSVTIDQPDGSKLVADRADALQRDFTLHDVPEGKELTYPTAAGSVASALESVQFEDVQPVSSLDFTRDLAATTRIVCFDGLVITTRIKDVDGKSWAELEATFEAPPPSAPTPTDVPEGTAAAAPAMKSAEEVQAEVARLEQAFSQWSYQLSTWTKNSLAKKQSELLKDKEAAVAPEADGEQAPMVIPGDLDPAIQEQIRKDLEAKGEKVIIGPPRASTETDPHAGHDHGPDEPHGTPPKVDAPPQPEVKSDAPKPDAPKPDEPKTAEPQR